MSIPAHPRRSLVAILIAVIAYGAGMGLTLPLLSLILERMGVPGSLNGLNLATAGLAALVVTPHVPRWMAKIGAAEFLALALAVAAAAMLTIYAVPNLWFWFPVRFALSSGLNSLFVVAEFWINQLATEKNRGRYIAIYTICFAGSFGIGPAILQAIGTRGFLPFAAGAAMLLLAIFPILTARRGAPRLDTSARVSVGAVVRAAPSLFAAALVFGAIDGGMLGLLPVYGVRLGYSEAHAALFVTAMALGSILFQYPLGALADRMNRRTLLALCAATGIIGPPLLALTIGTPLAAYFVLFVWGGLILGVYSIGLTLLGQYFTGNELASANAGFVMCYALGMIAGPAIEGVALDAWNPHGLLLTLSAISAAYVSWLAFRRKTETGASDRPAIS
ncbi:MAG TPA: MFS transporter [Rhizomicrobium sp.]|jgi:MFS family permease